MGRTKQLFWYLSMSEPLTKKITYKLDPNGRACSNQMKQSLSNDLNCYLFRQLNERLLSELWFKNGTLIYNQTIKPN